MKLIECVPNFSEGRRPHVMDSIVAAIASVPGAMVLDVHADAAHNRMVVTFAGPAEAVAEAAFRGAREAARLIDMEQHRGEHPRIGAADVVPFVPLYGSTMADCVELARQVGQRIAEELEIPVYLYAEAATRPDRRWLPNIRRGQYEALKAEIQTDPARRPDFGPRHLGPAGATAVGARPFLIAYNVSLATGDLSLARAIARKIRQSSGGLAGVQALGMATSQPDVVQVSMNLLGPHSAPLHEVFERVKAEADAHGVEVLRSEVVGLLPTEALVHVARHYLRASGLLPDQTVEARLARMLAPADPNG